MRWVRRGAVAFLLLGAVAAVAIASTSSRWIRADEHLVLQDQFKPVLDIGSYYLDDLGTADINDDGILDLFTTNHSADQHVLIGRGDGRFDPVGLHELGLQQTPSLPGAETVGFVPSVAAVGIHIFTVRESIVVRATGMGREPARVLVEFAWPARLTRRGEIFARRIEPDGSSTRLEIDISGDGELWIEPSPGPATGFPITIEILEGVPLDRVRVGALAMSPPDARFTLTPQDRHGIAWADYDGDDHGDLFISRGGVRGQGDRLGIGHRELFRREGGGFENAFERSGILASGCPGRQVAWEDVNADGRLDLYLVCGRGDPGDRTRENRLFLQRADGSFEERAGDFGLNLGGEGVFSWLDVDDDGDRDLLWAGGREVVLLRKREGVFHREEVTALRGRPRAFAVADFDADGDLDAFIAARRGALLLRNDNGELNAIAPATKGLPNSTLTASWVDTDNDGRLDFAGLPGGVLRQDETGFFQPTELLQVRVPWLARVLAGGGESSVIREARAAWLDADIDGSLDAAIALEPCWPGSYCGRRSALLGMTRRGLARVGVMAPAALHDARAWQLKVYRGRPHPTNRWLAVDLVGSPGNRDAIGARVRIRTARGVRLAQVGQLEGSHYSQGHRRLHFGLGNTRHLALEVLWPDGNRTWLRDPPANQLISVCHPNRIPTEHRGRPCFGHPSQFANQEGAPK